jgi:3-methyladenine DNA glycosylase Tag
VDKTKFITQSQFRRVFKKFESNEMINIQDLYDSYEEELKDLSVDQIRHKEREKIENFIMNDKSVLEQLRTAKEDNESGTSRFINTEEDFDLFTKEVKRN